MRASVTVPCILSSCIVFAFAAKPSILAEERAIIPEEIERLVQQLGSRDFKERSAAVKELQRIGKPAIESLRAAALTAQDPEVRARAKEVLQTLLQPKPARRIQGPPMEIISMAISADGRRALSTQAEHSSVVVWEPETPGRTRRLSGHKGGVSAVALSRDGRRALTGGFGNLHNEKLAEDYSVRLWDLDAGRELGCFEGHTALVYSVVFSADQRRALSGSNDGTVRLWNLATGKEERRVQVYQPGGPGVFRAIFANDERRIVACSGDRSFAVWELETGKDLVWFSGHSAWVYCIALSPDGKKVLSGCGKHTGFKPGEANLSECTMRLWDAATGKELRRFEGFDEYVVGVAFSPDGRYGLSLSREPYVRLWDLESGRDIQLFKPEATTERAELARAITATFSPDGKQLFTGHLDNSVYVWDMPRDLGRR